VPNLLPSSVFGFQLDWIGSGGRLVWAVIFTTVGLLWIMLLMKAPAVKSFKTGLGILVVGTGAGAAMAIAGKTVLENSLTGDSLIPFGFMIAWMSFIGGIWALIMALNVEQLKLPFTNKVLLLGTFGVIVVLYLIGGFVEAISVATALLMMLTILASISIYIWSLPKREQEATWAEAIFGALFSFVMMTFIYAIIPHEWITFASSYLDWTKDVKLSAGGEFVLQTWLNGDLWTKQTRVIPFELNMEIIQDHATMAIYVITAIINIKLFAAWQKRNTVVAKEEAEETADAPKKTSRFGRPLKAFKTSKA